LRAKKILTCGLISLSFFITGCEKGDFGKFIDKIVQTIAPANPKIQQQNVTNQPNNPNTIPQLINNTLTGNQKNSSNPSTQIRIVSAGDQEDLTTSSSASASPAKVPSTSSGGQLQSRISQNIRSLIGSTNFRGADVGGGNLACAKVVSTALKAAGALNTIHVNCDSVVSDLTNHGWKRVQVPPYQDGDVVTWTTSRGPGRHIGIIVKEGNTFMAISNSSSRRTPRMHSINYQPITQVLRKA
jgi:hypothetical protein